MFKYETETLGTSQEAQAWSAKKTKEGHMDLTEKHVIEARQVAVKAHGTQDYDGIFPYEKHLDDVVAVLKRFSIVHPKYLCAGYLHDTIEDGAVSYNKIKRHFGIEVAEMVYCVTDEMGRDRKEKKTKTLPKTASNKDAIIIKLADRIANIEHGGKIDMYAKEYSDFKQALFIGATHEISHPLWDHLETLLKIK
jgi:(p)ppGpp synthase/HD superfamily hydrolase